MEQETLLAPHLVLLREIVDDPHAATMSGFDDAKFRLLRSVESLLRLFPRLWYIRDLLALASAAADGPNKHYTLAHPQSATSLSSSSSSLDSPSLASKWIAAGQEREIQAAVDAIAACVRSDGCADVPDEIKARISVKV